MQRVRAKKYLGQHFLNDQGIAKKIVESLTVSNDFPLLEIGPGMGVLTQYLVEKKALKLIEIDKESVLYLKEHYPVLEQSIIEDDFLKANMSEHMDNKPFAIIGNFPYNISSQIFFKVLEMKEEVTEVVCMIQREVGRRIASGPGNKDYGILSVLLQAFYDIEYLFTVNEGVFTPPPKVKSAVIRLKRNNVKTLDCSEKMFKTVVKSAFNLRRKTLRNSLKQVFVNDTAYLSDNIFNLRPEQLQVSDFVRLAQKAEEADLRA